MTQEPIWMEAARLYIGQKEVPGPQHNHVILKWLELLKAKVRDDETAWCATYVGGVLESIGITSTKSLAARSYLNWGVKLAGPAAGCIVVFSRPGSDWSGHVGFVVGEDTDGRLLVLGGNQGDKVSVAPFDKSRVLGYRMPVGEPYDAGPVPIYASAGEAASRNEA